ncbi:alpha/beta hydrolase family protein [Pedobacter chitinilyticus]|uniref:Uncharacterized protein n=1 Tax=Pedobacter chitinilyticus TaxID=2233776 RepID=A0A3S3QHV9_9SPHI|nr:alpha/beta hydrolase family protein [Pedobacter chitinilyticus]RWU10525.1 hypothetical protein DPV69_04090 [Pedobacter chitinilyticus]
MLKRIPIFLLILSSFYTLAQKQYNVLDWKADVSLNIYLVQQMRKQYEKRNADFSKALKTKAQTLAYIERVKQEAKNLFRKLPQKATLNAQITGAIAQDGYKIEKIIYQSFQDHHVTANLYVPNAKGKLPAVLLFCGHEDVSKATESYQKTAILLAKNGFVVFVIDPISQSERVQLTDANGKSLTRGSTTEHTLLNLSSNLLGTSVAAYELFDNQCGLDYLLTRKEVDTSKIACVGNSGGGMQTIYFAAIDSRVKAIVPCSYLASRENTLATTGAADGCAQIPNEGAQHLEMSDYLIAAAPKPTLVLAGRYDFIDYNGTLQSFNDLKKVYASLGHPEKLSLFTFDDGHGISKPKREKAVQWLRKWFYNDDRVIVEPELVALTDMGLFSSAKQKVSLSFPEEVTVQNKNELLYEQYAETRKAFAKLGEIQRKKAIQNLLSINLNSRKPNVEKAGEVQVKGLSFEKLIIRKDDEIPLPALIAYPKTKVKNVVIWLSDEGKSKLIDSVDVSDENTAYIFADLRGTGETMDKTEMNDPKYFSKDYRNAMLALHIGEPLIGQRAEDIATLLDFISGNQQLSGAVIEVNTKGNVGVAALHAAFFTPEINKLHLYQCLESYQQILKQPLVKDRYGLVVNSILEYYDIPDMVSWIKSTEISFHK